MEITSPKVLYIHTHAYISTNTKNNLKSVVRGNNDLKVQTQSLIGGGQRGT